MAKQHSKPRLKPTQQPRLSEVELVAVQIWLRWQSEVALLQRNTWQESCRLNRNPQTIATHRYWSDAFHALTGALNDADQAMAYARAHDAFPDATLDPIDVIARN